MLGACAMATAVACGSGGNSSQPLQPAAAFPNCTQTADFWMNNPNAWPETIMTNGMALGGVSYYQNQLLQILAQPTGVNGLVDLAQAEIVAKLNIAQGADGSHVSALLTQADALINLLLPPPIGLDELPLATTASLVAALNDFNTGDDEDLGPGRCSDEHEDAGTDAAADAGDASTHGNCTEPASFWLDNPGAWPEKIMTDGMTLGTVGYSQNQLLQILAQPTGANGLVDLAQVEIAVKLDVAAGADDSAVSALLDQADALIDMLLPPPVGIDVLPETATAELVASLNDYLTGVVGPGVCGADAGTDAGSDAASGDSGIDAGSDAASSDSGSDAASSDSGTDAATGDAGTDAASSDAGTDAASGDAGTRDASSDSGSQTDSGITL